MEHTTGVCAGGEAQSFMRSFANEHTNTCAVRARGVRGGAGAAI